MRASLRGLRFDVARAVDYPGKNYGLICFFDCLHDMGDPIAAARYAAEVLAPDGTVMLVEPFANDRVEDNLSPVARLYYAASTTLCCAHAISEGGTSRPRRAGRGGAPRRGVPQGGVHTLSARGRDALQPDSRSAPLTLESAGRDR